MAKKILIVGAGTIGLHCAYYLIRNGHEVEVIDAVAENDHSGCSYGNCGLIVPSHFIPIASPAMLKSGFTMLFDTKSPVHLPLLANVKNTPWFLKFMASANSGHVNRVMPALLQLNVESRQLYADIVEEQAVDVGFEKKGLLMMASTQKGWEEELELARIANRLGISTREIDDSALRKMEPDVQFNVEGAVLYESDGHLNPQKYMLWLKTYLLKQGVVFHHNSKVCKFDLFKGKITGVHTREAMFTADEIVLAAGVFSSALAKMIGVNLPLIAGKGYSMDVPTPKWNLNTPLILSEAKIAVTPMNGGIRLGSGMEFNGKPGQVRHKRVQAMLNRTAGAIQSFEQPGIEELNIWEGLRPVSYDGLPYIGRPRNIQNLIVAAGHAMMGMSLAPVTGKIVSELIEGQKPEFAMELLHPNR